MIIYILQILYKWIQVLLLTVISLFRIVPYQDLYMNFNSGNDLKDTTVVNDVTPYTTVIQYNSKLPNNLSKIITPGIVGLSYVTDDNLIKSVQEMEAEVIEKGTGAYGLFVGTLTGYGPDCVGCSTVGNVACKTQVGGKHSLITDGIYYTDEEYGSVRILSAATAFPCGTIVQVTKEGQIPFYAVVLDRGGSMNSAWAQGRVWMDLAYESNAMSGNDSLTGKNIEFSVQRWGW